MRIGDYLLLTSFGKGSGVYLVRTLRNLVVSPLSKVPTTGIDYSDGRLAICIRNEDSQSRVGVIDVWNEGRYLRRVMVNECPDIHDVKIDGKNLVVVSSEQNAIIWIDIADGTEVERKVFDGSPDSWHLNDLVKSEGEWLVSGFGNPDLIDWRSNPCGAGVIQGISSDRIVSGFTNPHSPRLRDGKLYVCNSGQNEILRCDINGQIERRLKLLNFTRGLYLGRRNLVVGQSSHRVHGGMSSVSVVNLNSLEEVESVPVSAAEIYGIQRVPRWATKVVARMSPSPF